MKTTPHDGCAKSARPMHVFVLAFVASFLVACAYESSETTAAAELPAPGEVEIVQPLTLADHARVPEKESGFVSAQIEADGLLITHDGTLRSFAPGDVLGGTQGSGYLVRVVSAR